MIIPDGPSRGRRMFVERPQSPPVVLFVVLGLGIVIGVPFLIVAARFDFRDIFRSAPQVHDVVSERMCGLKDISDFWEMTRSDEPAPLDLDLVVQLPNVATDKEDILWTRQEEVYEALRLNLRHPMVRMVHIFLDFPIKRGLSEIRQRFSGYAHKISIVPLGREATLRDLLEYGSLALPNRFVIIGNPDMIMGVGFEKFCEPALERAIFVISGSEIPNIMLRWSPEQAGWVRRNRQESIKFPRWDTLSVHEDSLSNLFRVISAKNVTGISAILFKSPLPCGIYSHTDIGLFEWGGREKIVEELTEQMFETRPVYDVGRHVRIYHNHYGQPFGTPTANIVNDDWSYVSLQGDDQLPDVLKMCSA